MIDKHIGEEGPVWRIIASTDQRDASGHRLYLCECKVCGAQELRRIPHFKHPTICPHKTAAQYYLPQAGNYQKMTNRNLQYILSGMFGRCYDTSNKAYRWYGAKGVRVCDEWIKFPEKFEEWALSNGYQIGLTIDRIDSNQGYYPENCRWISLKENARYKSTTRFITVGNKTMSGKQWAAYLQVGPNRINTMIRQKGIEATKRFIQTKLKTIAPEETQ